MKIVRIPYREIMAAKRLAARRAPIAEEICGHLIRNGNSVVLMPVKNSAGPWTGRFEIEAQWSDHARRARGYSYWQICGAYHSHPFAEAKPGEGDMEHIGHPQLMLIFSVWDKNYALWAVKPGSFARVTLIAYK